MRLRNRWISGLGGLVAAAALLCVSPMSVAAPQKVFVSPEAAMKAFGEAVTTNDEETMRSLFGADFRKLIPPVDADIHYRFLAAWGKAHSIERQGDAKALIAVGDAGWTLPIPLVKTAQGWRFDTSAGVQEMRVRRIGRDERAVIKVMLAIYDAQKEYASKDRNGDGMLEYASRFASSPGKRDGLYWPTGTGEQPSPLGPAIAAARAAGAGRGGGYYGYRYKLLTSQGKNAPGGAYDYVVHGRMIGGFAVVAWPARYGDTGVMTFMVSHEGAVYEKNLGRDTAARVAVTKRFDPDRTWRKVEPGS